MDLGGGQVTELAETGSETWQHAPGVPTDRSSSVGWRNVWAGGKLVATYDAKGIHYELTDPLLGPPRTGLRPWGWLGTKRVQANALGQVDETCTGLPFGNDLGNYLNLVGSSCSAPANALQTNDDATEHHFTQKERDTETGNDYFMARYYSSALGRFTTPDWSAKETPVPYATFDDPQSLNLYAYVRNNPIVQVDLDGHADCVGFWCTPNGVGKPEAQKDLEKTQAQRKQEEKVHEQAQQAARQREKGGLPPNGSPASAYPKGSAYCGDFVCAADGKTHIGTAPPEMLGNNPDENMLDAAMFVPMEKLAAPLARVAGKVGGEIAERAADSLFESKGMNKVFGKGTWANTGRYFRVGFGRNGATRVFRSVIFGWKVDWWTGGPL